MEWLLFSVLVTAGFVPLLRKLRSFQSWTWAVVFATVLLAFAGAKTWQSRSMQKTQAQEQLLKVLPSEGGPTGYISSDKCQSCHPDQYNSWYKSFHRTMTQAAAPGAVQGNFEGVSLELNGEKFRLERRGDEYWAEMVDPDWHHDWTRSHRDFLTGASQAPPPVAPNPPRTWKRVGMMTGSHHFQAYWVPSEKYGNVQFAFPFAWLIEDQRWVPRKDTFIRDPNAASMVQIWNLNCIMCHVTAGQPRKNVHDGRFASRVAEMGISCESCHGPAEQHVRENLDPRRRYAIHRTDKPDSTIINPARQSARTSSHICGQCHGMKWTLDHQTWLTDGFSYRPGDDLMKTAPLIRPTQFDSQTWLPDQMKQDREFLNTIFWPDGVIRVTGREYNGIIEAACHTKGELSCLSCHSMHKSHPNDQLAARMDGNQACLQCHGSFKNRIEQHTHHRADSSGSQCYNCHMPHNTYGLLKAVRSHHIENPNVKSSLDAGRPNACNLCHLDQTLEWTGQYLSEWYGQPAPKLTADQQSVSAALLWLLRGDAAQRALLAWNMGWQPAQEASGQEWLAPFLTQLLDDPYSAVRYMGYRSLRNLPGYSGFKYDYVGSPGDRAIALTEARQIWRQTPVAIPEEKCSRVLMDKTGRPEQETIDRLIKQRDNRPVELIE